MKINLVRLTQGYNFKKNSHLIHNEFDMVCNRNSLHDKV